MTFAQLFCTLNKSLTRRISYLDRMLDRPPKLLCPTCGTAIDFEKMACEKGHVVAKRNGVYQVIEEELQPKLKAWLKDLKVFREKWPSSKIPTDLYEYLPSRAESDDVDIWIKRQEDLDWIRKQVTGRSSLDVLDLGAWNCWLSNNLTKDGHRVIACDYFDDLYDGLGARVHYKNPAWWSLQIEVDRPELWDEQFDLIIFNHNFDYFGDAIAVVRGYMELLKPGGILLLMGCHFYVDETGVKKMVELHNREFKKASGLDIFVKPSKGYVTYEDRNVLSSMGFDFSPPRRGLWERMKQKAFNMFEVHNANGIYIKP